MTVLPYPKENIELGLMSFNSLREYSLPDRADILFYRKETLLYVSVSPL